MNVGDIIEVLSDLHPITELDDLAEEVEEDEGWRDKPYQDHLGKLTIGYGTLLENGIDRTEGAFLMFYRLSRNIRRFEELSGVYLTDLPRDKALVLANMSYQLGPDGLARFRNMLAAVTEGDWDRAADEGLNSRWAQQTPERAQRLMARLRA